MNPLRDKAKRIAFIRSALARMNEELDAIAPDERDDAWHARDRDRSRLHLTLLRLLNADAEEPECIKSPGTRRGLRSPSSANRGKSSPGMAKRAKLSSDPPGTNRRRSKRPSRMTLELPPRAREKLERLGRQTDQSLSEVIRRALSLYDLVGAGAMAGNKLIIRGRDGEREIVLAEFEAVEPRGAELEVQAPARG